MDVRSETCKDYYNFYKEIAYIVKDDEKQLALMILKQLLMLTSAYYLIC